jgi:hypothetical protein
MIRRIKKKMQRIHFKNDGQDILWWEVDNNGTVQACNMQESTWKGTRVTGVRPSGEEAGWSRPWMQFKPGDILLIVLPGQEVTKSFIHPVESIEDIEEVLNGRSKN